MNVHSSQVPLVSVVMAVFNGEKYLIPAIESISNQTFKEFEFIIIDDGSNDNTAVILRQYAGRDSRFRIFHQENRGLIASLNRGIGLARGDYVARMDADDISLPERLEKQVRFLNANPRHALVGTWAQIQIENRDPDRMHRHPSDSLELKWELLFNCPFVHSSIMMRRSIAVDMGSYNSALKQPSPEDYDLWSRIAQKFDVANIPEVLHIYREVQSSICRNDNSGKMLKYVVGISARNLAWTTGRNENDNACHNLAAAQNRAYELISSNFTLKQGEDILNDAYARLTRSQCNSDFLNTRRKIRKKQLTKAFWRWKVWRIINRISIHHT